MKDFACVFGDRDQTPFLLNDEISQKARDISMVNLARRRPVLYNHQPELSDSLIFSLQGKRWDHDMMNMMPNW